MNLRAKEKLGSPDFESGALPLCQLSVTNNIIPYLKFFSTCCLFIKLGNTHHSAVFYMSYNEKDNVVKNNNKC